ncbi:LOW QUALITY PROTEIN: hypothetical protein T265_12646, partial [Opisthorchis viverrini]
NISSNWNPGAPWGEQREASDEQIALIKRECVRLFITCAGGVVVTRSPRLSEIRSSNPGTSNDMQCWRALITAKLESSASPLSCGLTRIIALGQEDDRSNDLCRWQHSPRMSYVQGSNLGTVKDIYCLRANLESSTISFWCGLTRIVSPTREDDCSDKSDVTMKRENNATIHNSIKSFTPLSISMGSCSIRKVRFPKATAECPKSTETLSSSRCSPDRQRSTSQPCIKPRQRESALIKVRQRPRNMQRVAASYQGQT